MIPKRRERPLFSFEEICNRNGIHFDKSKPYSPTKIVGDDGSFWYIARGPLNLPHSYKREEREGSLNLTSIETPMGDLCAFVDENPDFPALFICLRNGECEIPLVMAEVNLETHTVESRVYADQNSDDYTHAFSWRIKEEYGV